MSPKRIIIIGTMTIVITVGAGIFSEKTSANGHLISLHKSCTYNITDKTDLPTPNISIKDDLHHVLGVSSDEEIHDALYNGQSLANIAEDNNMDVQKVINLQVTELSEQLDLRMANGSLSSKAYQAYKSELREIVTKSVFGGHT
jgi:hypothetical protein